MRRVNKTLARPGVRKLPLARHGGPYLVAQFHIGTHVGQRNGIPRFGTPGPTGRALKSMFSDTPQPGDFHVKSHAR